MTILVAWFWGVCNNDYVMTYYDLLNTTPKNLMLSQVRTLALDLMRQHNLIGWRFDFNDNRARLGVCKYYNRTIELSTYFVASGNWKEIKNIILHEIAHALVGAGHGHGAVWKRKALEIGCNGQRCGHMEAPSKYEAVCNSCGNKYGRNRLSPNRLYWCPCTRGGARVNLVWKRVS